MNSDVGRTSGLARQPIDAGVSHAHAVIALLVVAAGIAYGSLLPFEWRSHTNGAWEFNPMRLVFATHVSFEDLITNILIYIPFGIAVIPALQRRARPGYETKDRMNPDVPASAPTRALRHRVREVVRAGILGFLLSLALECLQLNLALRVASWTDVLINVSGTLIGAALAPHIVRMAQCGLSRGCNALAHRPFTALSYLLVLAWLVSWLTPFTYVSDTSELWRAFHRMGQLASPDRIWESIVPRADFGLIALRHAVMLILLGCVLRLAAGEWDRDRARALVTAFTHAMTLLVLGGLLQLLNTTHGVNAVWLLAGVPLISFGTFLGHDVVCNGRAPFPIAMRRIGLYAVALLVSVMLTGLALDEFRGGGTGSSVATPFVALWQGSMIRAAGKVLLLAGATVALTMAVIPLCGLLRGRHMSVLAGMVVVGFACLNELVQLVGEAAAFDATGPILVLVTTGTVLYCARTSGDLDRLLPRPVSFAYA